MTEREREILEAVHEIIRGGYSIDCEPDQDYVCGLIDDAVKKIINNHMELPT